MGLASAAPIQSKRLSPMTKRCSRGCQKMSATRTKASWTCADTTSISSRSSATSLSSSMVPFIRGRFPPLSVRRLRNGAAEPQALGEELKFRAGRLNDEADRLLLELPLIGRDDCLEARLIVRIPGQHDQDELAGFADDFTGTAVPPLPKRADDG